MQLHRERSVDLSLSQGDNGQTMESQERGKVQNPVAGTASHQLDNTGEAFLSPFGQTELTEVGKRLLADARREKRKTEANPSLVRIGLTHEQKSFLVEN